ncbi:MAG: PfaD family polyunsaturated fatty acid/polyketide biosynthesis protein [Granulosicoccus sp.]
MLLTDTANPDFSRMSATSSVADTPLASALRLPRDGVFVHCSRESGYTVIDEKAAVALSGDTSGDTCFRLPPVYPEWLGDRSFTYAHNTRFPYIVGEMARGIATPEMVIAAARAGLLGFYGSAGLPLREVSEGIAKIKAALVATDATWGANLIHSPQNPGMEKAVVDVFLQTGVKRVSASAFMQLSPEVVRYSALGLRREGNLVVRDTHVFAKVSRVEVAEKFMSPAPVEVLRELLASGAISAEQAELAAIVPVAEDITAESDSGGHTDNRPAAVLLSSLLETAGRIARQHGFDERSLRVGLAGGIATPQAVAGAFQMGAAYVLSGSINQPAMESGLSQQARKMLSDASAADVMMAPAADMFEQGVDVQVLKRGTLFGLYAKRLHGLYRAGATTENLIDGDRQWFEQRLGQTLESAWADTCEYLAQNNPQTLHSAQADGNIRFALLCRRYLFMASQWARDGEPGRAADYQIWCGPAMGAFNHWVKDTCLEPLENRNVKQIAWNLLEGAARLTRAGQLRSSGVALPEGAFRYTPQWFG